MAIKLKWDTDGKGEAAWGGDGQTYDGPVPPKGSYVVKLKRMTKHQIKAQGENHNKPRLSVLVEVVSGQGAESIDDMKYKYRGAPIWDGINIIKSQAGRANMFIHALTDGTDDAKRAIENKFWPPNMDVRAEKIAKRNGEENIHIKSIGPYKINSPNGEILMRITTRMGKDLDGNPQAQITQYLPYTGPKPGVNGSAVTDDDEDEDEDLLADADDDDDDEDLEDDDDEDFEDVDDDEDEPF